MKRRTLRLLTASATFFALLLPLLSAAQSNAGFVQGLWYDTESVFVGQPVRIYAAIRNNTGADLTGTVEFYVDDKRLERRNVSALNNRIIESWADWTPRYGTTSIRAIISRTEITSTASGTTAVEVISAMTEDVVFVDFDTDGDGIGDYTDSDDDNDGVSDTEELNAGTDPLVPDQPDTDTNTETSDTPAATDHEESSGEELEGLERYLNDSPADNTLKHITNIVGDLRHRLDGYRAARSERLEEDSETDEAVVPEVPAAASTSGTSTDLASSSISSTTASDTGFGEVKRVQGEPPVETVSIWQKLWGLITHIVSSIFTFLLWLLSLYLSHPIVVQLTLLFLILFFIYKVARRLGGRPRSKKDD